MSTRRVKSIDYDEDEHGGWDDDWGDSSWGGSWGAGWDEGWSESKPSAKASKPAAGKSSASKAKAQPKAEPKAEPKAASSKAPPKIPAEQPKPGKKVEYRIDPDDSYAYTLVDLLNKYAGQYSDEECGEYWADLKIAPDGENHEPQFGVPPGLNRAILGELETDLKHFNGKFESELQLAKGRVRGIADLQKDAKNELKMLLEYYETKAPPRAKKKATPAFEPPPREEKAPEKASAKAKQIHAKPSDPPPKAASKAEEQPVDDFPSIGGGAGKAKAKAKAQSAPADDFPSLGGGAGNAKAQAKAQGKAQPAPSDDFPSLGDKPKGKAKGEAKAKSQTKAKAEPKPEVQEDDLLDAPAPAAANDDSRPNLNLVVVGHVDAGKSTLMGHLLLQMGIVSQKQMHKFEKEANQIGKASFKYAWVLDEGDDERARGVTIDVCVKHFETESRRFTILDAPGHKDFVPNMLQGAVQADIALLVADTSHFDSGFERGGQTKEHLQLVRALGVSHVLVVVNKLDTHNWKEHVFEDIKRKLHTFITGPDCGFKDHLVSYVPLSGFTGENMKERKEEALKAWYDGPTLIEALNGLPIPKRPPADAPMRMPIADLYRSGTNCILSGRVESGTLQVGKKAILLPSQEQVLVKAVQSKGAVASSGRPGDYLDAITLPNLEMQFAVIGGVICDIKTPVPLVDAFRLQILVFDIDIPIVRGQQVMCYLHTDTVTATITRLDKLLGKKHEGEKRPKCLKKGQVAEIILKTQRRVCVEPRVQGNQPTSLSRVVLRDRGVTVGAGVVLAIEEAT